MMNIDENTNSVIAISVSVGKDVRSSFKAVKVSKTTDGLRLDWKQVASEEEKNLESFLKELPSLSDESVVIGVEPRGVAFYNISVPAVKDEQLEAIVRMQAERLLPLGVEQMQLTWRAGGVCGGKRNCCIAAARTDVLGEFVSMARRCKASNILLNCQAVARSYHTFFAAKRGRSVVVNIRPSDAIVLLVENGRLNRAVTIDVGSDELSAEEDFGNSAELFVHDLRAALESFEIAESGDMEVSILSESETAYQDLISYLGEAGVKARAAVGDPKMLAAESDLTAADIYEYIECIGMALLTLERKGDGLDLFGRLYAGVESEKRIGNLSQIGKAGIICAAVVVLFVLACFVVDRARLSQLKKYRYSSDENTNIGMLIDQQKARKVIAENRPDILNLLTKISAGGPNGLLLDTFTFKKQRPVTIAGHAKSYEQLYEFQKKLAETSGITDVKTQNPTFDEKKKQVAFTMTFHYKNFTRKK